MPRFGFGLGIGGRPNAGSLPPITDFVVAVNLDRTVTGTYDDAAGMDSYDFYRQELDANNLPIGDEVFVKSVAQGVETFIDNFNAIGPGPNEPVGYAANFANPMTVVPPHNPTVDAYGFSEFFGSWSLTVMTDGSVPGGSPFFMRNTFPGATDNLIIPGTGGDGTFTRSSGTWTVSAEIGRRYILTGATMATRYGVPMLAVLVTANDATTLTFTGDATGAEQAGSIASQKDDTNAGDGLVSALRAVSGIQLGNYRAVCTVSAPNAGTFAVTDPNGIALGTVTVGGAAFNNQITFALADGATDFLVGDAFTIRTGGWPGGADFCNGYLAGQNFSSGGNKTKLYQRIIFRASSNWTDNGNRGTKFFFFAQGTPGGGASVNHYVGLTDAGDIRPGVGLQSAFGFATPSGPNHGISGTLEKNVWYDMEILLIANTPGVYNGIAKIWIDGVLRMNVTDMGYFAADNTALWDYNYFDPTFGGGPNPIPTTQYVDLYGWYASVAA